MWLDEDDLQLSGVELGRGATSRVVEGQYQGRLVSPHEPHTTRAENLLLALSEPR